eukprot:TRINITY_DN391_c0_g1_i1.p1 TRINITY_DN391_c0_g1~~TRINITY_DN391_c0_g1_i1.p1  ORF type:complete len:160 (+),score=36.19 TRINITY_DN391_c0_g1_i1:300-779(+)
MSDVDPRELVNYRDLSPNTKEEPQPPPTGHYLALPAVFPDATHCPREGPLSPPASFTRPSCELVNRQCTYVRQLATPSARTLAAASATTASDPRSKFGRLKLKMEDLQDASALKLGQMSDEVQQRLEEVKEEAAYLTATLEAIKLLIKAKAPASTCPPL